MAATETLEEPTEAGIDALLREAEIYLAVVGTFRSLGCGPVWKNDASPRHRLEERGAPATNDSWARGGQPLWPPTSGS